MQCLMLLPICVWCVIVGEVLRPSLDDVSMPVLCVLRALDCVLLMHAANQLRGTDKQDRERE